MTYEIVELEEMTVAGLRVRTNNGSADMAEKIGGLWQQFFEAGIYGQIPGKTGAATIGLYTNYAGDEREDYDFYSCCQVNPGTELAEGIAVTTIPKGKYAKFIVRGDMRTAVYEFWRKLWDMPLKRKFSSDFEEYQPGEDMKNCEIHIYIALED